MTQGIQQVNGYGNCLTMTGLPRVERIARPRAWRDKNSCCATCQYVTPSYPTPVPMPTGFLRSSLFVAQINETLFPLEISSVRNQFHSTVELKLQLREANELCRSTDERMMEWINSGDARCMSATIYRPNQTPAYSIKWHDARPLVFSGESCDFAVRTQSCATCILLFRYMSIEDWHGNQMQIPTSYHLE